MQAAGLLYPHRHLYDAQTLEAQLNLLPVRKLQFQHRSDPKSFLRERLSQQKFL